MKPLFVAVTLALAAAAGCASSAEIQQGAQEHLAKADMLEARGDYHAAAHERAAADKQLAKARQRSYEEARYGGVYQY